MDEASLSREIRKLWKPESRGWDCPPSHMEYTFIFVDRLLKDRDCHAYKRDDPSKTEARR